jgi:sugar phosphate permease
VALAGVILGVLALPLATGSGWRGSLVGLGGLTAACGLAAWLLYRDRPREPRSSAPVARPSLGDVLRHRGLLLLGGVTGIYGGVQLALAGFLVLFVTERFGVSDQQAGALFSLAQAGGVIGRIGWGVFSDALLHGRRKPVMALIGLLAAASTVALSLLGSSTPLWTLTAVLFVTGLSSIGWNGISMTFVAEIAGREASATAAGFNLSASYLGILTLPPAFGWLVDATGGSYTLAFEAAALAYVVALLFLWRIGHQE